MVVPVGDGIYSCWMVGWRSHLHICIGSMVQSSEHPMGRWGLCSEPQLWASGWHLGDVKASESSSRCSDPSSASPGRRPQNHNWSHPDRGALPAAPSIGGEMLGTENKASREGDRDRAP